MNVYDFSKLEAYLEIPEDFTIEPTLDHLNYLVRQYVLHVTFENINIQNQLPLAVNNTSMIQKMTERHQGGVCYENNRLFHEYLKQHGFNVHFAQATVYSGKEKGWAAPNVHMTNIVELNGERYVVEAGFGASPVMAIPLNGEIVKNDQKAQTYYVEMRDDGTFDLFRWVEGEWIVQFRVVDRYLKFRDFESAMEYNQTSLDSHFVTDPLIVRNWETGHATMTGRTLTVTEGTEKTKYDVTKDNYQQFLAEYFDIHNTTISFFEK